MKIAMILPLALLAACSGGGAVGDNAVTPAPDNAAAPDAPVTANSDAAADAALGNIVDVAPSPTPTPSASATPTPAAKAFPAAFRGRWGINANDCDPKRDDNKGLMTVTADTLTFYESRAKLAGATVDTPTKLTAKLDWSGEGQTWRTTTGLTLEGGGKALVRTSTDEGDLRYAKCPA